MIEDSKDGKKLFTKRVRVLKEPINLDKNLMKRNKVSLINQEDKIIKEILKHNNNNKLFILPNKHNNLLKREILMKLNSKNILKVHLIWNKLNKQID